MIPGFDKDQEENLCTLLMGTKLQNLNSCQRFAFFFAYYSMRSTVDGGRLCVGRSAWGGGCDSR